MRTKVGRSLCASALLLLAVSAANAGESIPWVKSFADAQAQAKKTHKFIMVDFYTDWCGWCKKMENEILQTPEFASVAGNNFIFVMLDFPMNKTLPQASGCAQSFTPQAATPAHGLIRHFMVRTPRCGARGRCDAVLQPLPHPLP